MAGWLSPFSHWGRVYSTADVFSSNKLKVKIAISIFPLEITRKIYQILEGRGSSVKEMETVSSFHNISRFIF